WIERRHSLVRMSRGAHSLIKACDKKGIAFGRLAAQVVDERQHWIRECAGQRRIIRQRPRGTLQPTSDDGKQVPVDGWKHHPSVGGECSLRTLEVPLPQRGTHDESVDLDRR